MSADDVAPVDFDSIDATTEEAVCFLIDGQRVWVPSSVIEEIDEDAGEVVVQEWFAREKGLI